MYISPVRGSRKGKVQTEMQRESHYYIGKYIDNRAATRENVCSGSEGPDQTAQKRSLIRAFAVFKQNHWLYRLFQWRTNAQKRV